MENPYLQILVLIGQEQKTFDRSSLFHSDQLVEISYEELKDHSARKKLQALPTNFPIYISIDKDVLNESCAVTNWDQGEMSLPLLENVLKILISNYDVIGIDICGDFPEEDSIPEFLRAERINMRSDEELYHFLYTFLKEKESISHAKP